MLSTIDEYLAYRAPADAEDELIGRVDRGRDCLVTIAYA